ncbi:MAG: CHRD domain-containing protein [Proteobacteria bacterium]|nr:CHRD domain-containing protein [Pseudomonadota bacterium]
MRATAAAAMLLMLVACAATQTLRGSQSVLMTGGQSVPPVDTLASGQGSISINATTHEVVGSVTFFGMTPTAVHIHEGAAGTNGPVIVPFVLTGPNTFSAPPGSHLTDAQFAAFRAGNLYVNAHTAAHPGGEVRAQLRG